MIVVDLIIGIHVARSAGFSYLIVYLVNGCTFGAFDEITLAD